MIVKMKRSCRHFLIAKVKRSCRNLPDKKNSGTEIPEFIFERNY